MNEPRTRDLYVAILDSQLSHALSVSRYLDPRHDVWSILRACQEHPEGIRALAGVVRPFHRDSWPMQELDELIECLFPDELLESDEREQLVELLSDVEPRQLQLAGRHAGPSSLLATSLDWNDPVAVARRVESYVSSGDAPHPLLVFVDFVAHQLDAVRAAEHHRWIDRVANRTGIGIHTIRELCVSATSRLAEVQRFYFIVQLQPDGVDPNSYLMSVWLQQHLSAEEPLHRDDAPVTLTEVAERLPDLLKRAHTALGVTATELTLEFILPRRVIGHPIDEWEIDQVFPHRLGTSYPVIVRSLDRMRNLELHGPWRQKCRWLAADGHREALDGVYWLLEPGKREPSSLRASLLRESVVALAMAFPPKESLNLALDELSAALYGGMPVILWLRNRDLQKQFEQAVRELLTGHGLSELPARILRLRQRADEAKDPESAIGRHIALLWDDANRFPRRPSRLRAPR